MTTEMDGFLRFAQTDARNRAVRRAPEARVIEVIEVVFPRGAGVEGDPVRLVTAYYASDGLLLAENDPVSA